MRPLRIVVTSDHGCSEPLGARVRDEARGRGELVPATFGRVPQADHEHGREPRRANRGRRGRGGATLVDDLLGAGYHRVDVLDVSQAALDVARSRLGAVAASVGWIRGDVTTYPLDANAYDLWHDRAVFHFLIEPEQRRTYVRQALRAVKPGGHVIVATFGPEGPAQCLDVARYDADALHDEFGDRFQLVDHRTEDHTTPAGRHQQFVLLFVPSMSDGPSAMSLAG
ncbi:MAG TPA: class I SAM-dependent methyltransferase [Kofleriaceae bacterium]